MNRNEAVLRELNLYPQWVRRNVPVQPDAADNVQHIPVAGRQTTVHDAPAPGQSATVHHEERETSPLAEVHASTASARTEHHAEPVNLPASALANLGWPDLKQKVHDCTACKLRAGCTQTVFGVGDEKADWLFVGEGPGADEDALGEPFVGQAGKLLDNMLMAIKLKRGKNVYIANIVKCRPPGNRNPEPEEITQCLPYLKRQIELVQPKLIVALGKVASNSLLGRDATLVSLRGKPHDYQGIPMIVTYHPAYLLRTPSEKAKAWQDLSLAVRMFSGNV